MIDNKNHEEKKCFGTIIGFEMTYSVIPHTLFDYKLDFNFLTKKLHTFFEKAANLLTNSTYSKNDIFSFDPKSIQSTIQYVFSRYSVLTPKVFSHIFSFEGKSIQFCELISEAVIILPFEISSIVERLCAKFISKNVLNFPICKIRMNIYLSKLLQKKCAKKNE